MAWWRHDPSLWTRSSAHRYAQRVLRDHEAVLRTRCFSRTPSNVAQHQDQDDTKRPEGMTDLEWAQRQHYTKWRKRLHDHPYKALFGASEDMLRGKGLTDWEWVYKTFPRWMLREMDPKEWADHDNNIEKNDRGRRYGVRSEENCPTKEQPLGDRDSIFAQPVIKTAHYERNEFGIVSPSDLRRPKEGPHVRVVSKHQGQTVSESKDTNSRLSSSISDSDFPDLEMKQHDATRPQASESPDQLKDVTTTAKEASNRESTFINAFFAEEANVLDHDLNNSKSWRQTALQRQSAPNATTRPKARSLPIAKAETPATETTSAQARETIMIPSSQALVDNYPYPKTSISAAAGESADKKAHQSQKEVGWSVPDSKSGIEKGSAPARSASSILKTLPEDDIDFLSADDIRAAMGTRKSGTKSNEEKSQDRQRLEASYATTKPVALDEVVEAHVLNNYHVRRTQRELDGAHLSSKTPEAEGVEAKQDTLQPPPARVQIESSIDRMRRWIEEGGVSLSKHFWQDPIEAGAPSEADRQFTKQMAGLGKARRAREHISSDLETDLPMCTGLMERLKNDESRVEHAVSLLQSPRKVIAGVEISKNLRAIRERRLRNTYERTEKQFESACEALRELDTESVQKATNAFKRRLGIASRVLHKNHTLTRMLTWSAQARLDDPDLERSKVELYSEILTRLATLRDTQLALARLMDHAIQTYGVSFKPADEVLSRPVPTSEPSASEATAEANAGLSEKPTANLLTDSVATSYLVNEIQSQKAAMQGLSDDGYARAPKQVPRRSFEETSPLAHSLFRPFNLQLDSLGGKTEGEKAEDRSKEAFKQKIRDKKLVQEVRSAYEDVYGPITVEHRQVPHNEEATSVETREAKTFEMLKDDPVAQTAMTTFGEAESSGTLVASEPLVTDITPEEVATTPEMTPSSWTSGAILSEPSTTVAAAENEAAIEVKANALPAPSPSSTTDAETVAQDDSILDRPTHYTILVHDAQTDTLSTTTSTSGPPRDTSPALPLHQALSSLKAPARFIPYITPGLEVVIAKRHMIVLRDALDSTSSTRGFERVSASSPADQPTETFSSAVNPIDGTTRLSPTGYSGVEQSQEQLERDFEERRQAATDAARSNKARQPTREQSPPPKKKKGGVGAVVKTAIWASAVCYIVGVTAEVLC